ncbi:hypothetical protein GIB67_034296 [Kingdonia uniflora]|uniref:Aminotransferase-like plant mobile domain-containing protein n=1 Tax=Kingdonia uniflora TaxID=39325 RepID=A0A7J7NSF1_9MAGN|nr:hypothetical protein GIB67_034296 [Kingdonia uniflora]
MRPHGIFTSVIKVWKDISSIPPVGDAVVNIFGQFIDIRIGNSDNRLIQALTKHWWPTTHTFLFPCAEIEVTPLDLTMLRSLSIGRYSTQIPYDDAWSILSNASLDSAVTTGGAITGFSQLLEYWFYEYCGVGHPIVKEEVKFLANPRLRAWERGNRRKTNGQATNLFILGRYHIDHRTIETITWEPWLEYAVFEIEDVLTAKLLSCKRMSIQVQNENYKYYLGDRCWRQLTDEARIPLDPPLSMSPHIRPATLQEMRQAGFFDCEQFVIGRSERLMHHTGLNKLWR